MTDLFKKWMVAGLGLAALTKEKGDELMQDLVRQGQVSREEARELVQTVLKHAEDQRVELRTLVDQQVRRVLSGAGVVTREEYRALAERVAALEHGRRLGDSLSDQPAADRSHPASGASGKASESQEPDIH